MKKTGYTIPCLSMSNYRDKYPVFFSSDFKQWDCPCRFWQKYGKDHNEPCKHMIMIVTAIQVMPEILDNESYYSISSEETEKKFLTNSEILV